MNKLYNKIYEAVNTGIQKALILDPENDVSVKFHNKEISTEFIPYEYRTVDMGKAGIWCEYNLGAFPGNKPIEWYGDYYAWGETKIKNNYSWWTYEHCEGTKDTLTRYNENDRLARLETKDDTVTQILGEKFRTSTKEEYEKLIDNTTNEWVKNYKGVHGLNGRLFIAENGNTLFFPVAGCYYGSECYDAGEYGGVWTASLDSSNHRSASYLYLFSDEVSVSNGSRQGGMPVRGIRNSSLN